MSGLLADTLSPDVLSAVAGRPVRAGFSLVHSSRAHANNDKRLLFLVEDGAQQPFALIKWARGQQVESLRREQEGLALLRASSDRLLVDSCAPGWGPFPVGDDAAITIETYLRSRSPYARLRTNLRPYRLVPRHFRLVEQWLIHMAAYTSLSPRPFDEIMLEQEIEQPLRAFANHFGPAFTPPASLEATLAAARAHLGIQITPLAEHGDLWLANLLLSFSQRLYVVDWEHFRRAALPGFDMLLFSTTYAFEFPWRPFGWQRMDKSLELAYIRPSRLAKRIHSFLVNVCKATRLPTTLVPVLIPVTLARMSLRLAETAHRANLAESTAWAEALRAWWQRPSGGWLDEWAAHSAER